MYNKSQYDVDVVSIYSTILKLWQVIRKIPVIKHDTFNKLGAHYNVQYQIRSNGKYKVQYCTYKYMMAWMQHLYTSLRK